MKNALLRIPIGLMGVLAGLIATGGPLLFISNEVQESQSAGQYHGHASFWGVVGGSAMMLFLALFFGIIAYFLLRFSLQGPRTRQERLR